MNITKNPKDFHMKVSFYAFFLLTSKHFFENVDLYSLTFLFFAPVLCLM